MRGAVASLLALVTSAMAGALVALASTGNGLYAGVGVVAVMLTCALVLWPWATLPVAIIGGALASQLLGLDRVSPIVAVHLYVVLCASVAVVLRRGVDRQAPMRVRTPADLLMLAVAAVVALGAAYGLARGNPPHKVLVTAYELGVIPVYFFLATLTLTSQHAYRAAAGLYVTGAAGLALVGFAAPGRHGGLFSAIALIPCLVAAASTQSTARRALLLAGAGLFSVDVALSAYRSIWVASAIALALLLWRGTPRVRSLATGSLLVGLAITGAGALSVTGFQSRLALVGQELHASSGYRIPEATIGLQAFLSHPIAGGGFGHLVRGVFVSTLGVVDVGPIYHVFYVTLLVNGGILALVALLAALAPALRARARQLTPQSLAFQCLLFGALAAAAFAGPTDGHWELGVLPALVLLAGRPQPVAESTDRRRASAVGAGGAPPPPAGRSVPVLSERHRPPAARADGRGHAAGPLRACAIIVTYNSVEQIGACVEALLESGVAVSVVDNASSDGTCALVRSRFPEVRVLANHTNHGFAHAVNQALAEVHADAVLLVNPDCVLSPGTVGGLTVYLATNPDVGVVGPRLRDHRGIVANSAHPFETALTVLATRFGAGLVPRALRAPLMSAGRRKTHAACRDGASPVAVDWLSGACLAVRTTLLRSLGGLDAGYFMYYEDEELCLQAWRAGARVVYLPSVEAVHAGGASSGDPVHVWPHLYRSLLRFQARHRPRTYSLVRASILVRALLGVWLGAPRDALALVTRRPARRSLAWVRIGQIAVRGTRATLGQGS